MNREKRSIPRVTLKDIAAAAGVSQMSVSLALRNHPKLPESTRARIREIANQLGYRPDPALSALAAYRHAEFRASVTETLAWLTNWPTRNGWRESSKVYESYFEGARKRADELGYALEHLWLRAGRMSRSRFEQILDARRIRGIIVAPQPSAHAALELSWEKYTAVKIGYTTEEPELHSVAASDHRAMTMILGKLRANGYERIGCVLNESTDARAGNNWVGAFLGDHYASNRQSGTAMLMLTPRKRSFGEWILANRPEAIVTTHRLSLKISQWCEELGLKIPDQVGMAVVSNVEPDGDLSGIHGFPECIGSNAVDVLTGMLYHNERGIPKLPRRILIDGVWVEGKTIRRRNPVSRDESII